MSKPYRHDIAIYQPGDRVRTAGMYNEDMNGRVGTFVGSIEDVAIVEFDYGGRMNVHCDWLEFEFKAGLAR